MEFGFIAAGVDDMAPGHSGIPEITPQPIQGPVLIHPPKVLRAHTGRPPTPAGLTGGRTLLNIIPSIGIMQVCRTQILILHILKVISAVNDVVLLSLG